MNLLTGAPLILLLFLLGILVILGVILTWSRVHLWRDIRRNLDRNMQAVQDRADLYRTALKSARDTLASVIADTSASEDIKEQAVSSYQQIKNTLERQHDIR